ncbi:MAG TPA: NUDIX domain-containing protein [Bacteroidales bacterium]|nr:NUDIX domain-containing protein [Bacteroidales bacterium]
MTVYKVHFEDRFILLSPEPDRMQKYGIFHKLSTTSELYKLIARFQEDRTIHSANIYCPNISYLWKLFRIYFTEVKAAGGLVKHTSGRYLFIRKRGHWDLPKGHVDNDESPEECALTEVKEETGIKGHEIVKQLESSYHTYTLGKINYLKRTDWFLMKYDGEMIEKPETREEITEVRWLLTEEIPSIREGAWLSLYDLINKAILQT